MLLYPRTFRVGSTGFFVWAAPEAIDAIAPVTFDVGTYSVAMTQAVADVSITGISDDRATLTAAAGPVIPATFLKYGEAFLVTAGGESWPLRVREVDGTTIRLAVPVQREISLTSPATLQFAIWTAPIGPGNVTAATNYLGLEWTVTYTRRLPGEQTQAQGLLRVTRVVWQSGLTTHKLVETFDDLRNGTSMSTGFQKQIDFVAGELAARVDTDVMAYRAPNGDPLTIDDVQSQQGALERVHAYHVAALIHMTRDDEAKAEWFMEQAYGPISSADQRRKTGLYAEAMRPIWLDADRNGQTEASEIEDVSGPGPGSRGGGFGTSPRVSISRVR